MAGGRVHWPGLLPLGLEAVIVLEPHSLELLNVEILPEGACDPVDSLLAGLEEAPVASELRRAIARCGRGAPDSHMLEARLARLVSSWRRSARRSQPVLRPVSSGGFQSSEAFRRGPRIFLDRVGSNSAKVSWIVVGDLEADATAFEVELFGHRSQPGVEADEDLRGEQLGRFIVPGGSKARAYTLRRLRPLRQHRARVRALGPRKNLMSAWSDEVSFMTLSVEAARAAGHRMTADGFFAQSEHRICESVCGGNGEDPLEAALGDILSSALGAEDKAGAVKGLLDARYCKGGWRDFVRHGARYSQPPSERERRMQRMRLVISAKDLYKPDYSDGNPWSMGPFYYEELGRLTMEAAQRVEERIAAAGGA